MRNSHIGDIRVLLLSSPSLCRPVPFIMNASSLRSGSATFKQMADSCNHPMIHFPVYDLSILFVCELNVDSLLSLLRRIGCCLLLCRTQLTSMLVLAMLYPLQALLKSLGCSRLRCHCKKFSGRDKVSWSVIFKG